MWQLEIRVPNKSNNFESQVEIIPIPFQVRVNVHHEFDGASFSAPTHRSAGRAVAKPHTLRYRSQGPFFLNRSLPPPTGRRGGRSQSRTRLGTDPRVPFFLIVLCPHPQVGGAGARSYTIPGQVRRFHLPAPSQIIAVHTKRESYISGIDYGLSISANETSAL